jgi:hypothetical protein
VHEIRMIENIIKRTKINTLTPANSKKTLTKAMWGNVELQAAFIAVAHAIVAGLIDVGTLKRHLKEEINNYVVKVDVLNWCFVDVTIKSGGSLIFSAPGPHVFTAHSLIIEPGGKIVTNQSHVTFDCDYIEIK